MRVTEDVAEVGVFVNTGDQYGPFLISTRQLDSEPEGGAEWEDVVEFSVTTDGALEVSDVEVRHPSVTLVDTAGTYRIRVSARGRTRRHHLDGYGDAGEDPVEWYLLEAWPAPPAPATILRLRSRHAVAELAGPAPTPVLPEAEAGLAAAARIGRDIDDAAGARQLSGSTAAVTVERAIRGTRSKVFRAVANVINWTYLSDPAATGWVYGTDLDKDPYEVGPHTFGFGSEDATDQLSGSRGAIRTSYIEVNRPRRVIRNWAWIACPAGSDISPTDWPHVLPNETRLTLELNESRDDQGEPWTTISLQHDGLPIEWIDDMTDWWQFQLAIAHHRGFGAK